MKDRLRRAPYPLVIGGFVFVLLMYFVGPVLVMLISGFGAGRYFAFPPPDLSLDWYRTFAQDAEWRNALLTSIVIALLVAIVDVPLAAVTAYSVERSSLATRTIISTVLTLPAIVPVIVYAVAFHTTFANWTLVDSRAQLVAAHAVLGFPYAFLIMRAGTSRVDRNVEDAARTLGAGHLTAVFSVVMPSLKWHITIAAAVAFGVSFTEPILAIFLLSGEAATLPQKTWEGLRYGIDPRVVVGTSTLVYVLLLGVVALTARDLALRVFRNLGGGR